MCSQKTNLLISHIIKIVIIIFRKLNSIRLFSILINYVKNLFIYLYIFFSNLWKSREFFIWASFLFSLGSFFVTGLYQKDSDKVINIGLQLVDYNDKFNQFISAKDDAQIIYLIEDATKYTYKITYNRFPQKAYSKFLELNRTASIAKDQLYDPESITSTLFLLSSTKRYIITFIGHNEHLHQNYSYFSETQGIWYRLLTRLQILGLLCAFRLVFLESKTHKSTNPNNSQISPFPSPPSYNG